MVENGEDDNYKEAGLIFFLFFISAIFLTAILTTWLSATNRMSMTNLVLVIILITTIGFGVNILYRKKLGATYNDMRIEMLFLGYLLTFLIIWVSSSIMTSPACKESIIAFNSFLESINSFSICFRDVTSR